MLATAVSDVIDQLRPIVALDHGDVAVHDVDESTGVVTRALSGACAGCSSADANLRAGIERILRDRVPAVTEVLAVPGEACDEPPAAP